MKGECQMKGATELIDVKNVYWERVNQARHY